MLPSISKPALTHAPAPSVARELDAFFASIAAAHEAKRVTFLCIGTDRSTGDSLGPLVGTLLEERGFTGVIGTLETPCDADNLAAAIASLPEDGIVIAIDACLGRPLHVGRFVLQEGPLVPAQSVEGRFGPVGDYSIGAIVNVTGPKPYRTLQTTSLHFVMGMAHEIADAAARGFVQRERRSVQ